MRREGIGRDGDTWTEPNQPPSRSTIIMNQVRGEGRGEVGWGEVGWDEVGRAGMDGVKRKVYVNSANLASIKVYDYYEPGKTRGEGRGGEGKREAGKRGEGKGGNF